MLKRMGAHSTQFGEIHFATVHPGVVEGWHRHQRMALIPCDWGKATKD